MSNSMEKNDVCVICGQPSVSCPHCSITPNVPLAQTFINGKPAPWTPFGVEADPRKFSRGARSNTMHVHPGHFTGDSRERCMCCSMPEDKCLCIVDEDNKVIPMCPQCGERMDNCMCGEEE